MKKDNTVTVIDMGTKPTKEDKKVLKELKKEVNTLLKNPKNMTIYKF